MKNSKNLALIVCLLIFVLFIIWFFFLIPSHYHTELQFTRIICTVAIIYIVVKIIKYVKTRRIINRALEDGIKWSCNGDEFYYQVEQAAEDEFRLIPIKLYLSVKMRCYVCEPITKESEIVSKNHLIKMLSSGEGYHFIEHGRLAHSIKINTHPAD